MSTSPPTLADIFKAQQLLRKYMAPTPLRYYHSLSQMLEAEIYVKHENHTAIGSFKIRGGINTIANLTEDQRKRGVIVASTGNFGQSVPYGGQIFGVKTIVAMPKNPNPTKAEAIKNFGAELILHGRDITEVDEHVRALAAQRGYHYFNDAEDPHFVAGAGTCMLEILEDLPEVEAVIVPVGGGGLASGTCIAGKTIKPDLIIIGVAAEESPSPYLSWKEGRLVGSTAETFAEGIASGISFSAAQKVMREKLDDFILVSEDEMRRAVVLMLEKTHNLAEGAGAAALAGTLKLKERIKGKKTVLVQSGGNISLEHLRECLAFTAGVG